MNRTSFNHFVLSQADRMFFYANAILDNPGKAIMVVEEAMVFLWEHRKQLTLDEFSVVVAQKVRELAFYYLKNEKYHSRPFNNMEWEKGRWDTISMPHSEDVEYLLGFLPELHVELLCLRAVGKYRDDALARITGLGFNNIHSMLAEARKTLRKGLDPEGTIYNDVTSDLLERYYSGLTSVDEEEQLRLFFRREKNNVSSVADFRLFNYFMELGTKEMPKDYKDQLVERIRNLQKKGWFRRFVFFWER